MDFPLRKANGAPVYGPTAKELKFSQHIKKEDFLEKVSQRALSSAANNQQRIYALPPDTPDSTLLAFGAAFPHEDFARAVTSQPHAAAVAARSASINEIIRNISQMTTQPRKLITLVGPSPSQYDKFRRSFPDSEITVFQPTASSRDVVRWRHHLDHIHDALWLPETAVRADIVVALFSVGCFHPEMFAKACIAAKSSLSYVLHHWSAQSLIGEHLDPILGLKFTPKEEAINVAYADSPSYTDSLECTRAWLTADFRVTGYGFYADVLVDFSTMQLLKISIAPGVSEVASSTRFDFLDKLKVLPPIEAFPATVIPLRLWESTLDYASRQRADILTILILRNRISSLQHRVSIGLSVIQEALFCTDEIAHHLSLVALEVMRLRAYRTEILDQRFERGVAAKVSSTAILSSLNERSYGAVRAAELVTRVSVNASFWLPSLLITGSPALVSFQSGIMSSAEPTLLERIQDRLDTSNDRIELLSRSLAQCIKPSPTTTGAYYARARVWKDDVLVPRSVAAARSLVAILASPLPFEARFWVSSTAIWILDREGLHVPHFFAKIRAIVRGFAHAIPQGRLLVDMVCDAFAEWLGWDRSTADRVRNWAQAVPPPSLPTEHRFPPSDTYSFADPAPSSSSSSSPGDDPPQQPEPAEPVSGYRAPYFEDDAASSDASPVVRLPPAVHLNLDSDGGSDLAPAVNPGSVAPSTHSVLAEAAPQMVYDEPLNSIGQTNTPHGAEPPSTLAPNQHTFTEVINLTRPLDSPITDADTILDRRSGLVPAKKDYSMGAAITFPDVGHAPRVMTVGPNTLKLAIAKALGSKRNARLGGHAMDYLLSYHKAIRDSPERAKKGRTIEMEQFASKIATALSQPPPSIRKFDAVVDGLPAAGKSSMLRSVLGNNDVIVVPTVELAKKWTADLLSWHIRAKVLTQHKLLLNPPAIDTYRLMVVDEAFLLEIGHLIHLRQYARYSIAIGDQSQIAAFNLRKNLSGFPIKDGFARFWINAPYSLGLPADVLALGKKLGFAPPDALTHNKRQAIEYLDEYPTFTAPASSKHANICFNQEFAIEGVSITAHASQGSRPEHALVRVAPVEHEFVPLTGQFWVAISRATRTTKIYLCHQARESLRVTLGTTVNGFIRSRDCPAAVISEGDIAHESCMAKLQKASTAGLMGELGLSADKIEYQVRDVCTSYETPLREDAFHLSKEEINAALLSINCNYEGRTYNDVVAETELQLPNDPTLKATLCLDLQNGVKEATSTLEKAGVYFNSDDTKTEFYTIAVRYLSQKQVVSDDPIKFSQVLLSKFEEAYIDPKKVEAMTLPAAAGLNGWINSRTPSLFQPDTSVFGEEAHTVVFSSFLKAHAKAKNEAGFGTKIEKGQTIAAGHQSYNVRHTAYCRELQTVLPQLLYDSVFLDIGFSDEEFEAFCAEQQAYDPVNTQIDLSSQDSTHFEHHVLMFVALLLKYTSIPEDVAAEYLEMRRRFTVRAKSFATSQSLRYSVSWNLPSGDPYTLVANTIMEACSMAFIFDIKPESLKPIAFKGDDTYTKMLLTLTLAAKINMVQTGVVLKLDHCLPPFFAGRYILPSNAVFHDPIKHAAKYSVKRFDPSRVAEYVQAYRVLIRDASPYEDELLLLYGIAHHPSVTVSDQRILMTFVRSLKTFPGFLRFQNFKSLSAQYVDPPTNCIPVVFGTLRLPKPPVSSTSAALVRFCEANSIEYSFLPSASRQALRDFASRNPNRPVFSRTHVLCYLSETRYSQVPRTF